MLERLGNNAALLTAVGSLLTVVIWVLYLDRFYREHRTRGVPHLVIKQGYGFDLDTSCCISNMSHYAVDVIAALIRAQRGEGNVIFVASEMSQRAPEHRRAERPLQAANILELATFRSLVRQAEEQLPPPSSEADSVHLELEVRAATLVGPQQVPRGGLHYPGTTMSPPTRVTAQRILDLVMANRAIRAPDYASDHDDGVRFSDPKRGLQWGADVIPALMGLFRVEKDPRDDRPDGWVGFARHWRGATLCVSFDLFDGPDAPVPVLVVTAVSGRNAQVSLPDEDLGDVELPDEAPAKAEWDERSKRYQASRRAGEDHAPAAVKAYLAALPGWKRDVATRIDAILEREAPEVRRAVKWHIPFYGIEDRGWFASIAAFSKYVKLTFLRGTSLDPEPPVAVRNQEARCLHVHENEALDEERIASWVRQAAAVPGEFA